MRPFRVKGLGLAAAVRSGLAVWRGGSGRRLGPVMFTIPAVRKAWGLPSWFSSSRSCSRPGMAASGRACSRPRLIVLTAVPKPTDPAHIYVRLVLFAVAGVTISLLLGGMHSARRRAQAAGARPRRRTRPRTVSWRSSATSFAPRSTR